MAHRRDVELCMESLEDIRNIMNSIKSLAYMESRKLTQRVENQLLLMKSIEQAAADFISFSPHTCTVDRLPTAFILIGSEHGFCGDFNEQLLQRLQRTVEQENTPTPPLIAVGHKLSTRLDDHGVSFTFIEGADVAEEAGRVIRQIVKAVNDLRRRVEGGVRLTALFHRHAPEEVAVKRLLPPFQHLVGVKPRYTVPVLSNLPAHQLHLGLVDHYLFHVLYEIVFTSLLSENMCRVRQLEGAVRHLDERVEVLMRKRNQLRQQEIIEEIEVVLLGTTAYR
ncbi:MAG: hypothetical protein GY764_12670 [Halieaceae bacterium]|nr:hypothetical protein [Halieaceae bacterium]